MTTRERLSFLAAGAALGVLAWSSIFLRTDQPEPCRSADAMGSSAAPTPSFPSGRELEDAEVDHSPSSREDAPSSPAAGLHLLSSSDEDLISRVMVSAESRGATFEEEFLPTEAGLIAQTIGQWEDEDFSSMTCQAAQELLGDDLGDYDLSGDGLLLVRLGGFPTRDEAARAYETSRKVRMATLEFYAAAVVVMELQWRPDADLTPDAARLLDRWTAMRDAREDILCAALEEKTGYKHWRLLARLWRAYEK